MRPIFNTGLFLEPLLDAWLDLVRRRKISTDALETIREPLVPRYVNIFKHDIDSLLRIRYLGGCASWAAMSVG
jgi:hypothetical protein